MIILNRHKDYYDYLSGVYGVDTKKVLNRLNDITLLELGYVDYEGVSRWFNKHGNMYSIYIANRKYIIEKTSDNTCMFHLFHKVNTNHRGQREHRLERSITDKSDWVYYIDSDYNKDRGRVLSIDSTYANNESLSNKSPILSTFGFSAVLPPTEAYSEIDMMLGWHIDNPCKIAELDDKAKVLANGFDSKVSFRHRK